MEAEMAQAMATIKPEERIYIPEVYLTGGRAEIALGNIKAARESWQRAVEVDPEGLNGVQAAELLATLV